MGLRLHRVDEVGKLQRVLDEEHGDVVPHQVEVAFLRVELHGEAAHVAGEVAGSARAGHCGEAHEDRGAPPGIVEEAGARVPGHRFVDPEEPVGAGAARVNDALRDPLVIEVGDLLAEMEVFQQGRPPHARAQRVLVVLDPHPKGGRQELTIRVLTCRLHRVALGARLGGRSRAAGRLGPGRIDGLRGRLP